MREAEDAFGLMLLDHLHGRSGRPLLEVEGGDARPALGPEVFFAPYEDWPDAERKALRSVSGRVLDVGCGAGRHALHLQGAGCEVVAVDVSPGAVAVARARGVRDVRLVAAEDLGAALGTFDAFLMMCGNFGLVGTPERAGRLLARLAALARPGAVLVADCVDGPSVRLRLRYRSRVTPWQEWLNPSRDELHAIVRDAGWLVARIFDYDGEPDAYAAVLERPSAV